MSESLAVATAAVLANQSCMTFVLHEDSESESFGDSAATFYSPELMIRVVRDRGQVSVDFGSGWEPDEWFDLSFVADLVGATGDQDDVLASLARFIDQHCVQLRHAFSPKHFPETKQVLTSKMLQHARETFGSDSA